MPINKKYPLAVLMDALRAYPLPRRRRITIEYTLVAGRNDAIAEARKLAKLLRGLPVKVNLIPMNPIAASPLEPAEDRRRPRVPAGPLRRRLLLLHPQAAGRRRERRLRAAGLARREAQGAREPLVIHVSSPFMVPYIHVPDLHIGPLPLHPFGILVATGVLIGTSITARRARKLGYDVLQLNSFVTWMLVSAFVLSHMLDSVFYHWDEVVRRPLSVIMLWEGLSSFGGFVGAVVGIVLWKYFVIDDEQYMPRLRQRPAPILPFADLVLSVFPIGWVFGRAGCSTVHDHPGARATADTLLAVAYPRHPGDGTVTRFGFIELIHGHDPRFDLGLPRAPLHDRPRRLLRAHVAPASARSARTSSPRGWPTRPCASRWTSCASPPATGATRATER